MKSWETEALSITAEEVLVEVLEACHELDGLFPQAMPVLDGAA
jgi:hypothetical protein